MNKTNCTVVVNPEGKFLSSAWFATGGAVKARWVAEYPDCAEFTSKEAIRTARKLLDAGVICKVVENYGLETEHVAFGGECAHCGSGPDEGCESTCPSRS